MPNLRPQRRKPDPPSGVASSHRCAHCREDLHLIRRHESPARLGAPLITEFYRCGACDSGYAFTPKTGRWKAWAADDE